MSANRKYWTPDRIMHLLIGLAIAAVLWFLISELSDVLLPFFVACFIAYLLEPMVAFNMRWTHTKGRVVASLLTILEFSIVIVIFFYAFTPTVVKDLGVLSSIIQDIESGKSQLPPYYATIINFVKEHCSPEQLRSTIESLHFETLINKGTSLLEGSIGVFLQTLEWLLTLIYIIFILIDYPQIVSGLKQIFPYKYRARGIEIVNDVKVSMNHYFRGQGVVALCAMVLYCVGFSIAGLPLAIPMGVIVGILYMIPYFQYVTLIPVAIIVFIYSLGGAVEFLPEMGKCILVYVFTQCICDYLITPHVMGKEMGLNPAIILLALSIWGSLLGIIGMIIALPLTSLIMAYYQRYISDPPASATDSGCKTASDNTLDADSAS